MTARILCSLALIVTVLLMMQASRARSTAQAGGYAGIEFLGSPQISRSELEKDLSLKPGASYEAILRAVDRLKTRLQKRNIDAVVDVVKDGDNCYVTVDVIEPGATGIPVRKLQSPHTVYLTSDLPFTLLQQMFVRIEELSMQGRPVGESVVDGVKQFADEPCNQIAKKMLQVVPLMRAELLQVVQNDPDPKRRSRAIECLNWDTQPVQDCLFLIPIIDDGAQEVRMSTARYVFPRLKMLPDNFPIEGLVEGFSHQLSRPSHMDRSLALRCLAEVVRTHPYSGRAVQQAVGDRVQQLLSTSQLSSIKGPAQQLLDLASHAPVLPKPRTPATLNEF